MHASRDFPRRGDVAIAVQLADPDLAAVPGHVGVVPGLPGEARAIGAQLRRGVEVVAEGDGGGLALAKGVEGDDRVDSFSRAGRVVLTDRDDAIARFVDDHVRMPEVCFGCDRSRRATALLPVQALVFEVGEEDGPVPDRVMPAAILMHPAARVEALGRHIADGPVRVAMADDDPSRLVRTQLRPVEVLPIPPHHLVAHVHGTCEQKVGRDR